MQLPHGARGKAEEDADYYSKSNDPVRLYLRKMGTVSLLTREGEVEIAKRIEQGEHSILNAILNSPVAVRYHFVEANLSGDKKATTHSFMTVRGRKVTAEVRLSPTLVTGRLHTTTARLMEYWHMSALGGVMSGSIGVEGHYANSLAALFIATGQDVAGLAEYLAGLKRKVPDVTSATLLVADDVDYDTIVQVMDATRARQVVDGAKIVREPLFPQVALGDAPT